MQDAGVRTPPRTEQQSTAKAAALTHLEFQQGCEAGLGDLRLRRSEKFNFGAGDFEFSPHTQCHIVSAGPFAPFAHSR